MSDKIIRVTAPPTKVRTVHVNIPNTPKVVRVKTPGQQGRQGDPGATGPQGPAGSIEGLEEQVEVIVDEALAAGITDVVSDIWEQTNPSASWNIVHSLSFRPTVTIVDSAGTEVEGAVQYTSATTINVTFSGAFSGVAYLS